MKAISDSTPLMYLTKISYAFLNPFVLNMIARDYPKIK